jgi:hypothetical protein
MTFYETNYLEKKLNYAPTLQYKPTQLNPAKGMSYKESEQGSSSYDKMQPQEIKSDYPLF